MRVHANSLKIISGIVRAQEVVAEHIQAKTLNIDGMYFGRMVTRQGDVAYHFLLKDDSEVFQEGICLWIFQTTIDSYHHCNLF